VLKEIENAVTLVENGEVERGLSQLMELQEHASHQDKYAIAELLLKWGLLDDAKRIVDELLMLYPDEGQLYILAAEIFIDLENEEEALDILQEVNKDDPSYTQALILMADLYQVQGLDEVAEQKLLEAKKTSPQENLIDFGLGDFYLGKGDYKKSIPYFKRVLSSQEWVGETNIHLCLAEALTVSGNFEEALEHYDQGLKEKTELHALFGFAFTAFKLERYELAIAKWNELKELDPEYQSLYLYLAQAYELEGAINEAYDTAKEGLQFDQYNKELLLYCGKLALKLHHRDEAESFLREAISYDPGYMEAIDALTKLLLDEDRYEEVVDCIEHSTSFGEYDPQFEWDLGIAKKELEQFSDALNHYQSAYNSFKDNVQFLEGYGFFLLEEGRREDARQIFERIISIDPSQTHIEEEIIRLQDI
jgi:tetratricopeptide (TPR) repeat protein